MEELIKKIFNDLVKDEEFNIVRSSSLGLSKVKWVDFKLNHVRCFMYESRKRKITIDNYFLEYFMKIFGLGYAETRNYLYPLIKTYIKQI